MAPRREAEELLAAVLDRPRSWLHGHGDEPLHAVDAERFAAAVARRVRGEPVAYVVGRAEFRGRWFRVGPAVLVPRPETEMLADIALSGPRARRTLDAGTGSGVLAVTLALEGGGTVIGSDVSAGALAVAAANARDLGAAVRLVRGDGLEPFGAGRVDLVVANPPYVAPEERDALPVEVRDHEPALSLFSPEGGLHHVRAWLGAAARVLAPGGRLLMEIGFGQSEAAAAAALEAGLVAVRVHPDHREIPRVLEARAPRHRATRARSRCATRRS